MRQQEIAARGASRSRSQYTLARGAFGAAIGGGSGGPIGAIAGAAAFGQPEVALGVAAAEMVRFASSAAQSASNVTEAVNKVNVTFGESGKQIVAWSQNSARAFGQNRAQALETASSFGILFHQAGIGSEQAAQMSERMTQLGADIASFNNIPVDEALQKLQSGLVGEVRPLREVGVLLNAEAVTHKAVQMGLARTTAAVTDQQKVLARYALILEQTQLQQGDFARTSTELANSQRKLSASSEDLKAKIGETTKPMQQFAVNAALFAESGAGKYIDGLAGAFGFLAGQIQTTVRAFENLPRIARGLPLLQAAPNALVSPYIFGGPGREGRGLSTGVDMASIEKAAAETAQKREDLAVQRYKSLQTIDRSANQALIDSASQYASQRADVITQYDKQIARDAEDYARQRARAEQKYEEQRSAIVQNAAEKQVELATTRDENIADARAKSQEKLLELEQNYNKQRLQAERSHRESLLEAAGRLDAAAVAQEQRRYANEQQTQAENYSDAVSKEKKNLDDQIAAQQKNYEKQLTASQKQADEQLTQLKASYDEQRRQEEEDRQIRLERQKTDHDAQLAEMDAQQYERIQQIKRQAAEQRQQVEDDFQTSLHDLGMATDAWIAQNNKVVNAAITSFDAFWRHVTGTLREAPIGDLLPR